MSQTTLSRNQHAVLLALMGAMLVGILLAAGIYLSEFWFWVVWAVLGLGGWSNRYYNQRKTPGWALVPSGVMGGVAFLYYFDQILSEG